jgi:hypothetical protein
MPGMFSLPDSTILKNRYGIPRDFSFFNFECIEPA